MAAGIMISWMLGFLFLLLGSAGGAKTIAMWPARGFWYSMISAILAILLAPALTLLLFEIENYLFYLFGAFFVVEGMAMVTYALDQRRERSQPWRWMLLGVSGAGDVLVGIVMPLIDLGMLPRSFDWILMAAITLLIGGATKVAVAFAARGDIHDAALDPRG
jgi:uncharacterized membrane protein HdeD (DUF308 family)